MRITDAGGEEGNSGFRKPVSSIMESIKAKSIANAADEVEGNTKWEKATGTPAWEKPAQVTAKVTADVQSNKLKQLLNQIKQ
jgi:hypothetical protein